MARLYADENFDYAVVEQLRLLGHDVLTAQATGQAQQRIPDHAVLAYAISGGRAVLTFNRRHVIRLHTQVARHSGIIVCTKDDDSVELANRIHHAVQSTGNLDNHLLRVNLPPATP